MRALNTAGRRRNKLLALALGAMPLGLCSMARADRYWKDSVTADTWSATNDWSATSPAGTDNAGAPGASDNVYIQNTTNNSHTVTVDESDTVSTLQIGDTGGGTDTLSQTSAFGLSASIEQVGAANGSVGMHTQSAGTNTYSNSLVVGSGTNSIGTYNLSGTGSVDVDGMGTLENEGLNVGAYGSGTFNQSGGAASIFGGIYLGYNSTGTGTYLLGGGALTTVGQEWVGYAGLGTFNQSGGVNTISDKGLAVGFKAPGTYTLSGGTLTALVGTQSSFPEYSYESMGDYSAGTFNQSGGTNTTGTLYIASYTAPGTYLLSAGTLNVEYNYEFVGYMGAGSFSQTGGVQTLLSSSLILGEFAMGSGTYLFSGGTLTEGGEEIVGGRGAGTFNQTGGVQTIGASGSPEELDIAGGSNVSGMYSLSGTGSLGIYGNVYVGGSSTGTGGIGAFAMSGGTMSATGGITVFSGCNFAQTGGSVTAGSLTINSGGSLNLSGGTLSSSVIVAGKLTTTGSPTAISISGPFTLQSTATTLAQLLGSTPAFGAISSTGNMTLAGSLALYVDAANEATTTAGQSFIILQATGSGVLSGAFSNIASGQTLTTADGTASFVVTINEGTDGDVVLSDFQMVPEPGMASVMGAVAAMGMMRRRRRELKVKNLEDDHLLGGDGVGDHCSFLDDGKRMGMGAVRERYPYHEAAAAGGGLTFRRTAARRPPSGESISI